MAQRKSFLLRLPPGLADELNRWAKDELRSLNAQIEYLLREAIRQRRRSRDEPEAGDPPQQSVRNGTNDRGSPTSESQE